MPYCCILTLSSQVASQRSFWVMKNMISAWIGRPSYLGGLLGAVRCATQPVSAAASRSPHTECRAAAAYHRSRCLASARCRHVWKASSSAWARRRRLRCVRGGRRPWGHLSARRPVRHGCDAQLVDITGAGDTAATAATAAAAVTGGAMSVTAAAPRGDWMCWTALGAAGRCKS